MTVEILRGRVGSHAYGLATPDSDIDELAIHVASTREMLGLSVATAVSTTRHTTSPDFTSHELGKFCELALDCNPTLLELLWLSEYEAVTDAGQLLVDSREAFLSTDAVRSAYAGYARSQARKIDRLGPRRGAEPTKNPERLEKMGRHTYRLLLQGRALLTTGILVLDVSEYRDKIFAMGKMAVTIPHEYSARVEVEARQLNDLPSVLPEICDRDRVDELVRSIRTAQVRHDLDRGL